MGEEAEGPVPVLKFMIYKSKIQKQNLERKAIFTECDVYPKVHAIRPDIATSLVLNLND